MTLDAALREAIADALAPVLAELREVRKVIEQRGSASPWLTRQELAEQLGCHVDTIDRRAAARDGVEARRVGRAVRVRLVELATEDQVAAAASRALDQ